MMSRLKSVEFWCFLLLMVNVVTVAADLYFRRAIAASTPLPPGQMISGRAGITAAGKALTSGSACHLVRYASTNCPYCSARYSQAWDDLERALTGKGCDAIIVSPYATDLPPGDGVIPEQRLAAVSLQFMESTRFGSTPITLLADRDWKIIWSRVGVLDEEDYRQAVRIAGF